MKKSFLVLVMMAVLTPAYANDAGQPTLHGKTYGEWSAKWWKWVRSIPAAANPLLASGDMDCRVGQSGPMFFLAGTAGVDAVERTCTSPIPREKELFFSPMNLMFYNGPSQNYRVAEKRQILDGLLSDIAPEHPDFTLHWHACKLAVIVDGVSLVYKTIPFVRTQSPGFFFTVGDNDVFGDPAGTTDEKAVADGFWVALHLSRGAHTLQVKGDLCDQDNNPVEGFHQDYTYNLRVK